MNEEIERQADREAEEYGVNEKALNNEFLEFKLWYKQYYLHKDPDKLVTLLFKKELERRLRRMKELEIKMDIHYYSVMMEIMTPEFLKRMF